MATISENYLSRTFDLGQSTGRELVYDIIGTEDETAVESLLLATAPATYLGLQLDTVNAEPQGGGIWKGFARYSRVDNAEYTFQTGGGTRHVTQGYADVASFAAPGFVAPDFQGAINVTEDKVEGADFPDSRYEFSETHYFDDATVTDAYKFLLVQYSGRTMNSATFRGLAAGECMLLGVTGSKRGDERWSLTFSFAGSPNVTGLTVGPITGISKLGWDYLWIRHAIFEDSTAFALVSRPVSAHVVRVLVPVDYANLLI
jgi:hypothetical protein